MKLASFICLLALAAVSAVFVPGCSGDDDEGESFACCQSRNICTRCVCGSGETDAFSGNESQCKAFLDRSSTGCGNYPRQQALDECSN